jgi:single-strand DNA-binding protein
MCLNRVELIGFLGHHAEVKTTQSGKAVTTLSLATKTSFMKDGERQERTEWYRIQTWAKLDEYAAAFRKGSHIRVEGELRSREYETDGSKVRTYEIIANSILNLRTGQRDSAADADADHTPVPAEGTAPQPPGPLTTALLFLFCASPPGCSPVSRIPTLRTDPMILHRRTRSCTRHRGIPIADPLQ